MLSCHQLAGVLAYRTELARYPSPDPLLPSPKPFSHSVDNLSRTPVERRKFLDLLTHKVVLGKQGF